MNVLKKISKKLPDKLFHRKFSKKLCSDNLLYKYVLHDKNTIGESVAIADENLIIKDKVRMLCVSFDVIERVDDEYVHVTDFNYDEALAAGEAWFEGSRDTLHFDEKGMPIYE